ncbi:RHS repeat-associated core domain-containing protein [Neolewinella aurantiaca]|uniref:RHS repeat-associated core domain-containing protein n=1 Tax=Neolewinella aurantiaca TaxID=2602767 RepID=UPI00164F467D|nr:RHS repeat-associated core domain-containing protein [Neolewinella aurantiaca]
MKPLRPFIITGLTFRADGADAIQIDYAADYYPYGKILREYKACNQNRYLSTHHERDKDTGYDNRGARLYDSEIGRFLGVDPLASEFPAWSPYNYVMGNPVRLVDPDGKMATGPDDPPKKVRTDWYSTTTSTALPNNGVRIYNKTTTKTQTEFFGSTKKEIVVTTESSYVDVADDGVVTNATTDVETQTTVIDGVTRKESSCSTSCGDAAVTNGSVDLRRTVGEAVSFGKQQSFDAEPNRNFNYVFSGQQAQEQNRSNMSTAAYAASVGGFTLGVKVLSGVALAAGGTLQATSPQRQQSTVTKSNQRGGTTYYDHDGKFKR